MNEVVWPRVEEGREDSTKKMLNMQVQGKRRGRGRLEKRWLDNVHQIGHGRIQKTWQKMCVAHESHDDKCYMDDANR